MTDAVSLHPTRCAVCDTEGNATEVYPARLDTGAFNPAVFSARRTPDRIHYRIVRCNACGLVRSDPVADSGLLARLYAESAFGYADEVVNLRRTYGRYLARLGRYGARKGALLEVGCGNGFFLEEALAQGYATARGVEPSAEAVAGASAGVRKGILCDAFRAGLFPPEAFDVICLFQVFDHLPDPGGALDECLRLLRPGGLMLCIHHNIEAFSARLLRERSPIVDVEHTYLYSPATVSRLFEGRGFLVRQAGPAFNRYSLHYLTRLAPLPARLKGRVLAALKQAPVGLVGLWAPLGNMYLIAQRPAHDPERRT